MPHPSLNGKVIVIIGGTTGLGLSAARACIAAGAKVAVVGRNPERVKAAQTSLGTAGLALEGDATESGTAAEAISAAVQRFGAAHGLYHVAGGSGRSRGDGPLDELTDEGWRATIDLNLTSCAFSNRAAVKHFLQAGHGGSVVNMGSVLGWSPSPRYFATYAYAATKAAIIGMTRNAAATYASRDIRFNAIAPALVETPMAKRAASDENILEFIKTKQPLDGGRIGQPADCDGAAVFLLSDAARYITGQTLAVDGGWCVSEGQY